MKTIKLRVEGEEKLKFYIEINFDEATVILYKGGMPTKYTHIITLNDPESDYYDALAIIMERLYKDYLNGLKIQEEIIKTFEDKSVIAFPDFQ